jgi:capsular polysaccharide biosynthesis protein
MKLTSPEILRRLVRRFGLLVLLTLIGGSAGFAYGAFKTPTYVAQAYVVATGQPGDPPVAVNFAQAYGRIVTTGPVADRAATALGSNRDLSGVTASTSPDTPVIEITATGTDAKRTAAVANAVAQALVDFGNTRKDQTRVTLSVLAPASVPPSPTSPKPPLELAVGAAAGLVIGGLSVLAGVGKPKTTVGTASVPPATTAFAGRRPLPPIPAAPGTNGALEYQTRAIAFYAEAPRYTDATQYTEAARPEYVSFPIVPEPDDPAVPDNGTGAKVVGRAVVIYQDPR